MENKDLDKKQDIFSFSVSLENIIKFTGIVPFPDTEIKQVDKESYPWNIQWEK